jgi:hypothetical protein
VGAAAAIRLLSLPEGSGCCCSGSCPVGEYIEKGALFAAGGAAVGALAGLAVGRGGWTWCRVTACASRSRPAPTAGWPQA